MTQETTADGETARAGTTADSQIPAGVAALPAAGGVLGLVGAAGYLSVWNLPVEGPLNVSGLTMSERYVVPLLIVPLVARVAEAGLSLTAAWLLARSAGSAGRARTATNLLAVVLAWGAAAWLAALAGFAAGAEELRISQLALGVSSSRWVAVLA